MGRAKTDDDNFRLVNRFVEQLAAEPDLSAALALLETNKARTLSDILVDPGQKALYQAWRALQARHAKELEEKMAKLLATVDDRSGESPP